MEVHVEGVAEVVEVLVKVHVLAPAVPAVEILVEVHVRLLVEEVVEVAALPVVPGHVEAAVLVVHQAVLLPVEEVVVKHVEVAALENVMETVQAVKAAQAAVEMPAQDVMLHVTLYAGDVMLPAQVVMAVLEVAWGVQDVVVAHAQEVVLITALDVLQLVAVVAMVAQVAVETALLAVQDVQAVV